MTDHLHDLVQSVAGKRQNVEPDYTIKIVCTRGHDRQMVATFDRYGGDWIDRAWIGDKNIGVRDHRYGDDQLPIDTLVCRPCRFRKNVTLPHVSQALDLIEQQGLEDCELGTLAKIIDTVARKTPKH